MLTGAVKGGAVCFSPLRSFGPAFMNHFHLKGRSGLATERVVAIPPTESPVRRAAREERPTSPRPPADSGGGEDPPSPSVFYV